MTVAPLEAHTSARKHTDAVVGRHEASSGGPSLRANGRVVASRRPLPRDRVAPRSSRPLFRNERETSATLSPASLPTNRRLHADLAFLPFSHSVSLSCSRKFSLRWTFERVYRRFAGLVRDRVSTERIESTNSSQVDLNTVAPLCSI